MSEWLDWVPVGYAVLMMLLAGALFLALTALERLDRAAREARTRHRERRAERRGFWWGRYD